MMRLTLIDASPVSICKTQPSHPCTRRSSNTPWGDLTWPDLTTLGTTTSTA
jgi:hypothetical protein